MWISFLRHGIAEELRAGLSDADRRLTDEGIREMEVVARGIARLGLKLDAILTSPLKRARETAAIVLEALNREPELIVCDELAYDLNLRTLSTMLKNTHGERVLLVGHEPTMSETLTELIGGGSVRLKKSCLAVVKTDGIAVGAGELRMLVPPEVFVSLVRAGQ